MRDGVVAVCSRFVRRSTGPCGCRNASISPLSDY